MSEKYGRSLGGQALAEVERRVHGRLRAHHLSSQLISRHLEDAVQKGVVEWLRVESRGEEIRDPKAFVVEAAFRRTIDEVRRESRRADGATLDGMLERGTRSSSSAEDVVIESLESIRLQEAIDSLPAEQRQVLALHYFAEVDQRRAAEVLCMSERTFRRRLKEALSILGERLGVTAPEQGSLKGMEIGLAAWVGLGGGRILASSGIGAQLQTLFDLVQQAPGRIADRLRGSGTSLIASEAPERVGAIAGGPAGKVIGGCAGAAVVCALSGVVGPGLELGDSGTGQIQTAPPSVHHKIASQRPIVSHRIIVVPPRQETAGDGVEGAKAETRSTNTVDSSSSPKPARRQKSSRNSSESAVKEVHREAPPPTEVEAAEEEFSGISRAASESEPAAPEIETETGSVQQAAPVKEQPAAEPTKAAEPSATPNRSPAESEFGFEK